MLLVCVVGIALAFAIVGTVWWDDDVAADPTAFELVFVWGLIAVGLLLVARLAIDGPFTRRGRARA